MEQSKHPTQVKRTTVCSLVSVQDAIY